MRSQELILLIFLISFSFVQSLYRIFEYCSFLIVQTYNTIYSMKKLRLGQKGKNIGISGKQNCIENELDCLSKIANIIYFSLILAKTNRYK